MSNIPVRKTIIHLGDNFLMSEIVTEYNETKNVFFDVTKTHYYFL